MKKTLKHIALLLRSTTFWTSLGCLVCEGLRGLDPVWLADHPTLRAAILPAVAVLGVAVKIGQNQVFYLSNQEKGST